jgi:hypothetical protein
MTRTSERVQEAVGDYWEAMAARNEELRAAVKERRLPHFFVEEEPELIAAMRNTLRQQGVEALAKMMVDIADEIQGFYLYNPSLCSIIFDLTANEFADLADELDGLDTETSHKLFDAMHRYISQNHAGAVMDAYHTGLPAVMVAHALGGMQSMAGKLADELISYFSGHADGNAPSTSR